jgi:hypothetical protein
MHLTNESTYKAAGAVARTVESIFTKHLATVRERGEKDLADVPNATIIEAIIDAAFWASLRREEGHSTRISLAFLSPEQAAQPIVFANRLPLMPHTLTKLSPGFERPGIHLGVWEEEGELYIWGATLHIPNCCFVLDVSEPGLVVIKHRRLDGFGKFSNIAVLTGDEVKVVEEYTPHVPECPAMVKSWLDFTSPTLWNDSVNVLLQLAVSMRAHGRGGTLLVVPARSEEWLHSIRQPLHYSIAPRFSGLADLMRQDVKDRTSSDWQKALNREVEIMAGLTAIDGAIVMNDEYELLAFGEKITRIDGNGLVEQLMVTEPIVGGEAAYVHPAQSGGTRHLSAAQFVHDQRDSIALVASQDGRFTVFTWSTREHMVQAHRIDTLLL